LTLINKNTHSYSTKEKELNELMFKCIVLFEFEGEKHYCGENNELFLSKIELSFFLKQNYLKEILSYRPVYCYHR